MNDELAELQALQLASSTRLLVIDDEPLILASLEALLKHKHYQVDTALSGKLACQQLEQNHYDLVFLDLNMADVDGFAVMAFMADQGIDSAIVVVSGESTFDDVRKAFRMGASDYVKKPYSPEELFATIDSTFHKINLRFDALSAISTDISEEVSAREERLLKSNALFSKAEQIGNLGHWEWDEIAGEYITCSEQYSKILDMTVARLMGEVKNKEEKRALICENDRERYNQVVDSAVESKQGWDIKYSSYTKAGRQIYLHEIGISVLDDHGVLVKTIGTIQDTAEISRLEEELKQSNALFHQAEVMGNMGHFYWDLTKDKLISCSAQYARIYGKTVPEALDCFTSTQAVMNLIHPDDKERFKQNSYCYNELTEEFDGEFRIITSSGDTRHLYERGERVFDNAGEPSLSFGTLQDITERKQAEDELKLSTDNFERVFNLSTYMVCIASPEGYLLKVSPAFTGTLGYSEKELLAKPFVDFIHPDEKQSTIDKFKPLSKGVPVVRFPNRYTCKDGSTKWLEWTARTFDSGGNIYAVAYDITDRKNAEEKLEHIAHYDILTDLPNRELLADRLSHAMVQCQRRNQSLAVAYMDLDGFKAVNDTHGHDLGDKLLVELSKRMKEALREGDTLARIGGDEFIAIMVDLESIEGCKPVLERLLKTTAEPVTVDDTVVQVSLSIGVTLYPQDGVDGDQLMRHADQAMYIAKQAGKNRYQLFDAAQDSAIKILQQSIGDVRSALDRREFVLHYQPKVNMHTGDVIGVEALIRWQHPVRGLVPPLEFLPAIEGHAISLELGEWVIDTALRQIIHWRSMGVDLPISVNISAYQLQQANFIKRLSTLLAAHPEVDPHYLELEILESSVLSDISQVFDTMNVCHELGVHFSLDDFGTGYSSLTHIKRLPAYLIKIDQSFVRDMLEDIDDLAIVESVVGLAKTFKREVIAEGVETIEHGVALLQLGCELAQGYGIARPMTAGDIPEWISNWKADDSWQAKSPIE
jgi:diguanylate cyclase (GGDEF)-like protein/PAS domain S-box-containing protein